MLCAAALAVFPPQAEACTRAVYLGPDGMTVTGRTMDWREDPLTNLYIFPRGGLVVFGFGMDFGWIRGQV